MLLLLKDCMYKNSRETNEEDGDDGVKDLIEMTMRKMDQDRDGRVSYSDFMETVQEVRTENAFDEMKTVLKEPLLMEAFGNCLPTNKTGKSFLAKILDQKPPSQLLVSE